MSNLSNKKRSGSSKPQTRRVEKKYFPFLLASLGILFVLFALFDYFSFQSDFFSKLYSGLTAEATEDSIRQEGSGYSAVAELCLWFFPAIAALLFGIVSAKSKPKMALACSISSAIYLLIAHGGLLFNHFMVHKATYTHLTEAAIFLFIPVLLLFWSY